LWARLPGRKEDEVNAPVPVIAITAGAIPFYKSPQEIGLVTTVLSGLIALFPRIGAALGHPTQAETALLVQNVFGTIALLAPLVLAIHRARSPLQPLTLTPAAAEVHPATLTAAAIEQALVAASPTIGKLP